MMRNLLVWLVYVAVFLVFTWPLSLHPATTFPVVPGHDSYQFYWNVWHFRHALEAGTNPWYTTWLFYPEGSWLIMHAYIPIVGLLAVAVRNEMLAINLALLLSYSLSGLGAYRLAGRWVQHPLLCVLAGFIFAYSPYKMQRLPEHYNLVLTATVPFYVLYFLRAFRFRVGQFLPEVASWQAVAACAGLGLVTVLSDYYVLFGLLYFSAFYAAWFGLRIGQINWRSQRVWLGLVVLFTASHISIRLLRLGGVPENGLWWAGDLLAFLLPPPTSRWLDFSWSHRLYHSTLFNAPGSLEITLFVGYLLPLLALLSCRRAGSALRQDAAGRPLVWVLLLFGMLTVPTLRLYGHERLNLPTAFIHFVPFINNIRCPTRWVLYITLLLPLVSFSSLEAGWFGKWPRWAQYAVGLGLAVGLGVEFWPKPYVQATAADVPAVYRYVAGLPGESLISVPFGVQDGNRQIGLPDPVQFLYQQWHLKKLLGGYLSRVRPEQFAAVENTPFLRSLMYYQAPSGGGASPPPLTGAQVAAFLRRYQPAAFVLPPAYRQQPVHRFLRRALHPYGYQEQNIGGYVLLQPQPGRAAGPSAAGAAAAPVNLTPTRYTTDAAVRWR
ncbi:hypothetical protein [Hymenobacter metallilatus]|uniref:Glycosyltransferase RgtA/B/C/D-like domain-containing protein n=1 Tax=Hymenobacter metallilatus TaxID=2493666 RepID=A0A3R9MV66_9BACT|nr:hypothetical protein [Hymenobacter metallilatus]RSK31168.1 hypothetical protein EI290_14195 [Hymenobacter metallilatus]